MQDIYEFSCYIDDEFKKCKNIAETNMLFIQMSNVLTNLFNQNIALKVSEDKEKRGVR